MAKMKYSILKTKQEMGVFGTFNFKDIKLYNYTKYIYPILKLFQLKYNRSLSLLILNTNNCILEHDRAIYIYLINFKLYGHRKVQSVSCLHLHLI